MMYHEGSPNSRDTPFLIQFDGSFSKDSLQVLDDHPARRFERHGAANAGECPAVPEHGGVLRTRRKLAAAAIACMHAL